MNFYSAEELLKLCEDENRPICEIMRQREVTEGEMSPEEVESRMQHAIDIMYDAAHQPLVEAHESMGTLIGGEAAKIREHYSSGNSLCGKLFAKTIAYAMAVLEVNSSMGVIVAAPTAGSSGVLPAVMFAIEEEYGLAKEKTLDAAFTAGAVGYLLMRNASVAGAEAGCQAEIGSASAMAAAAAVEMMGGSANQCIDAASLAIANMLGLACDPVAGLVEVPCQTRNALGAANALICAEIVLSGIRSVIPFSEMSEAMYRVGTSLPKELRETALGGCAATPTACRYACWING